METRYISTDHFLCPQFILRVMSAIDIKGSGSHRAWKRMNPLDFFCVISGIKLPPFKEGKCSADL